MAFHVACPITCRRICDCELGFPEGLQSGRARGEFLEEIAALEEFLKDPWTLRIGGEESTVQTLVPRVVPPPLAADEDGEEAASAQAKRAALQRQAVAASLAAEDYVRGLEAGGAAADLLGEAASTLAREDQGSSTMNVICRICFSGENEGSDRAIKMLSCKICNKKYHRSCLKSWAEYRDLFHWSSWACPSCRICEVCRRAGDPNKLMYCKRCDGAYHCYCQQPPHKNVGHGPYLCPKHTRCHSCGSTVPGSGVSTRWFLGYTCCDACGRLFVKGNYCPVCLKVYRDSETTPMVCCDVCERWVHCVCDGISDEKYQQYQADQNLQYKCAACRGECYQVKDIDDAVRELWRRRDEADRELIASFRVGAGLPSQEEIFSLSPYSDDEQSGPVILKNDYGRSLMFSVKGFSDKSTKNSKECGKTISKNFFPNKKYTKKKGYRIKFVGKPEGLYQNFERQNEERSLDSTFRDPKPDDMNSYRTDGPESLLSFMTRSPDNDGMKSCDNQLQSNKYISVKEVGLNNVDRVSKVQSEGSKLHGVHFKECAVKNASKNETFKGTKLVIHLGSRNRNVSSSPRSETSSCHRKQDLAASYGSDDISQPKTKDSKNHMHEAHGGTVRCDGKGAKLDNTNQMRSSKHGDREKKFLKLGKISDMQRNSNGNISEECEQMTKSTPSRIAVETVGEVTLRNAGEVVVPNKKQSVGAAAINLQNDGSHHTSRLQFVSNDPKPLLKLKFKNPYFEQQSSWASRGEEENPVKGQRSKRKRPATTEKAGAGVEEDDSYAAQMHHQENIIIDQVMDANWILQKLGKDAIGKRVEVQQLSDNSWHEGVVSNVTTQGRGTSSSSLSVHLDDGRCMTVELGKQGVRFVSQNSKKRAKI